MKTIIVTIIVGILFFLWLSEVNITLKPFSISLPAWRKAVGWTLIVIGISYVSIYI